MPRTRSEKQSSHRYVAFQMAIVRCLYPLLRVFGVEKIPFFCLVETRLHLDSRPTKDQESNSPWRAVVSAFDALVFLGVGSILGAVLYFGDVPNFAAMTLVATLLMFVVGLSGLFAVDRLFDTEEWCVLGAMPITGRTILAARVVHVSMRIFLRAFFVSIPPFIAGLCVQPLYPWLITFPLVFLLVSVEIAFALITLYLLAIRVFPAETIRRTLSGIQVLAMIVMSIGPYGASIIFKGRDIFHVIESPVSSGLWLLPCHFGGLYHTILGNSSPWGVRFTVLAVALPLLFTITGFNLSAKGFTQALQGLSSNHDRNFQTGSRAKGRLRDLFAKLMTRGGPERAGFNLLLTLPWRDHGFLFRCLPSLAMPMIFLVSFSFTRRQSSNPNLMAYCFMGMVPLMLSLHTRFTTTPDAKWIFAITPMERASDFAHGTLKAICFAVVVPYLCVMGIVATFLLKAQFFEIAVASTAVIWTSLAQFNFYKLHFPFIERFHQSAVKEQMLTHMAAILLGLVVIGGSFLVAQEWPLYGWVLLGLLGITSYLLFRRLSKREMDTKNIFRSH